MHANSSSMSHDTNQKYSLDSLRSSHPVEVSVIDVNDINQVGFLRVLPH